MYELGSFVKDFYCEFVPLFFLPRQAGVSLNRLAVTAADQSTYLAEQITWAH